MQKPDFSGDWRLNREASGLSPVVAPVVQSGFVRMSIASRGLRAAERLRAPDREQDNVWGSTARLAEADEPVAEIVQCGSGITSIREP